LPCCSPAWFRASRRRLHRPSPRRPFSQRQPIAARQHAGLLPAARQTGQSRHPRPHQHRLGIIGSLWGIAVLWLLLSSRWAAGLAAWAERRFAPRWLQGLLFFAVFLVITTLAACRWMQSATWSAATTASACRAGEAGLKIWARACASRSSSARLFCCFSTGWSALTRELLGAYLAVHSAADRALVFASPLLDPIFNKFEPLTRLIRAGCELETVVARTGTHIAPDRMFLMKASAKSNGLNAYVTGIGATKRFVMWDTATDRLPDDEVLFIFGHESGHYVLNHIPEELSGSAAGLFFVFWACAGLAGWLARRFGVRWQLGDPHPLASRQGFVVLLFALSIAGFILQPAGNTFSRHFEHEATSTARRPSTALSPTRRKPPSPPSTI